MIFHHSCATLVIGLRRLASASESIASHLRQHTLGLKSIATSGVHLSSRALTTALTMFLSLTTTHVTPLWLSCILKMKPLKLTNHMRHGRELNTVSQFNVSDRIEAGST